jgi:hypothetical protein
MRPIAPSSSMRYTLAGREGGGGSIFWKTRDIGLGSYSNNLSTALIIKGYFYKRSILVVLPIRYELVTKLFYCDLKAAWKYTITDLGQKLTWRVHNMTTNKLQVKKVKGPLDFFYTKLEFLFFLHHLLAKITIWVCTEINGFIEGNVF